MTAFKFGSACGSEGIKVCFSDCWAAKTLLRSSIRSRLFTSVSPPAIPLSAKVAPNLNHAARKRTPRMSKMGRTDAFAKPSGNVCYLRILLTNLKFLPRSQSGRPLAASMEIWLGAQRSDRSSCVRSSLRPRCGKYPWRQHYARACRILAAPQFPTFSTVSAHSCHYVTNRKPALFETSPVGHQAFDLNH